MKSNKRQFIESYCVADTPEFLLEKLLLQAIEDDKGWFYSSYAEDSMAQPCECGGLQYYLSPIVGARCCDCNKPLMLKSKS